MAKVFQQKYLEKFRIMGAFLLQIIRIHNFKKSYFYQIYIGDPTN